MSTDTTTTDQDPSAFPTVDIRDISPLMIKVRICHAAHPVVNISRDPFEEDTDHRRIAAVTVILSKDETCTFIRAQHSYETIAEWAMRVAGCAERQLGTHLHENDMIAIQRALSS